MRRADNSLAMKEIDGWIDVARNEREGIAVEGARARDEVSRFKVEKGE